MNPGKWVAGLIMLCGSMSGFAAHNSTARVRQFAHRQDWSGVWAQFNLGLSGIPADPDERQRFFKAMAAMRPPYNSDWAARYQRIVDAAAGMPAALHCSELGFPTDMLAPVMMQVVIGPDAVVFLYNYPEYRYVPTDGRAHPPAAERWPTLWGDSVGRWQGDTLLIDTVSSNSPIGTSPPAPLSPSAHFTERLRQIDANTLDYQLSVDDAQALSKTWLTAYQFHRVPNLKQVPYQDCSGNDRNPVVNGEFTIAPP